MTSLLQPTVRILLVDDDEDDFLITRENLAEIENTHFEMEWCSNPDEAFARLNAGIEYDVCLLDYRMGRRNGLEVLQEMVAAGYRLPVILLTGQEDQDVDRMAVRLGASDYLVKGSTNAVSLERSIRYAIRQKSIEEQLRQQTEFVSAIVDTAGALVIVLDRTGRIIRFNRTCEQVSGYTAAEVSGRVFYEFLLADDERERVKSVFADLSAGRFPNRHENDWMTPSGERRRIVWSNTAICDTVGQVEYVIATGIDVTEQRKTERALAEAREREIEVGANIQQTLLVRRPPQDIPGVSLGAVTQAAQRVGGDYLDFFVFEDGIVDVLVGDVMGKGVPAALLAAATKGQFQRAVRRLLADTMPFGRLPEPKEIVSMVHHALSPELFRLGSFVTLLYARFNTVQQTLTLVDCGHPSLIHWVQAERDCTLIIGDNMPLGMSLQEQYLQQTLSIAPGDLFFFYSDGLFEPLGSDGEPFGTEGLMASIARYSDLSPQEMAESIGRDVAQYAVAGEDDDRTCVVVRVHPVMPPRRREVFRREVFSTLEGVEIVREFVENTLGRIPQVAEDAVFAVGLAVHEAMTNIVRHAYGGRTAERIQVLLSVYGDRVEITLLDTGLPFVQRDAVPVPIFDGTKEGGFGIFLIESAVDVVEYQRDDAGRNRLRLTRFFKSARGA